MPGGDDKAEVVLLRVRDGPISGEDGAEGHEDEADPSAARNDKGKDVVQVVMVGPRLRRWTRGKAGLLRLGERERYTLYTSAPIFVDLAGLSELSAQFSDM